MKGVTLANVSLFISASSNQHFITTIDSYQITYYPLQSQLLTTQGEGCMAEAESPAKIGDDQL